MEMENQGQGMMSQRQLMLALISLLVSRRYQAPAKICVVLPLGDTHPCLFSIYLFKILF